MNCAKYWCKKYAISTREDIQMDNEDVVEEIQRDIFESIKLEIERKESFNNMDICRIYELIEKLEKQL